MGILNVTPDSFSDGGRFVAVDDAVARAMAMLDEGAHILDIGGESTRPNAVPTSADEEQERVLPVIEALLKERPGAVLSIDTFHAATAQQAVQAGAEIVNDVSGFTWDVEMAAACAGLRCGVVLMHTRGKPQEWAAIQALTKDEVLRMVLAGLRECVDAASHAGVARERIVVDPGFGFGKKGDENYTLLAGLEELRELGLPVLSGTSRKGFLGASLKHLHGGEPAPLSERVNATTAANVASVLAGAHILRVHDVRAAVESAAVADAILAAVAR
ncbi:dihydropteroate synthase [Granulicella aggregans]|uniref:dihydropteroate synthase n=1 Tax=Granulicella aggregans TaxID=474949 RepID=UPI0021E0A1C0|nr:dihydropteroate synthase [Granulicella aggregans]